MENPGTQPHPDDEVLLRRFRGLRFSRSEWTHEMHLRIGWLHVRRCGPEAALQRLRSGIRRLNAANGVVNGPDSGYHETVTRVWVALIDAADAGDEPPADSSAAFLKRHPELLDRRLPLRFYRRDRIVSEQARAGWVEPDLEPLPESRRRS